MIVDYRLIRMLRFVYVVSISKVNFFLFLKKNRYNFLLFFYFSSLFCLFYLEISSGVWWRGLYFINVFVIFSLFFIVFIGIWIFYL